MKCEACDLKFTAATSNTRQMLSDRVRAKLSRRQLAKHSIALQETKLNMRKCWQRVVLWLFCDARKVENATIREGKFVITSCVENKPGYFGRDGKKL